MFSFFYLLAQCSSDWVLKLSFFSKESLSCLNDLLSVLSKVFLEKQNDRTSFWIPFLILKKLKMIFPLNTYEPQSVKTGLNDI